MSHDNSTAEFQCIGISRPSGQTKLNIVRLLQRKNFSARLVTELSLGASGWSNIDATNSLMQDLLDQPPRAPTISSGSVVRPFWHPPQPPDLRRWARSPREHRSFKWMFWPCPVVLATSAVRTPGSQRSGWLGSPSSSWATRTRTSRWRVDTGNGSRLRNEHGGLISSPFRDQTPKHHKRPSM